jgi:hypothetical protein
VTAEASTSCTMPLRHARCIRARRAGLWAAYRGNHPAHRRKCRRLLQRHECAAPASQTHRAFQHDRASSNG